MSYEPSHRKPPRQERWPNATPGEGWPAYQHGDGGRAWESEASFAGTRTGYAAAGNGYGVTSSGYGDAWGGRGTTAGGYGDDTWGGRSVARYGDAGSGYAANGYGYTSGGYADHGYEGSSYGGATTTYPAAGGGYADGFDGAADGFDGAADGFDGAADGFDGAADGYVDRYGDGYGGAADGYGRTADYYETPNDWDGYTQPGHEFTGTADYLAQEEYPELDLAAASVLVAPDTLGEWWRQADRGDDPGRDLGERGPVVGAMMGVLAAAVAIGVATFAAAFVRPEASPVSAVSVVFGDRIPAALKNHLMAHFGAHGLTVLLLGAIGLIAVALGFMARRNVSVGVAGLAAFGLLGAFVAVTRPESRASDVIPSAIGGLAGIVALLWLARASAPVAALRPASGGGRRRAR